MSQSDFRLELELAEASNTPEKIYTWIILDTSCRRFIARSRKEFFDKVYEWLLDNSSAISRDPRVAEIFPSIETSLDKHFLDKYDIQNTSNWFDKLSVPNDVLLTLIYFLDSELLIDLDAESPSMLSAPSELISRIAHRLIEAHPEGEVLSKLVATRKYLDAIRQNSNVPKLTRRKLKTFFRLAGHRTTGPLTLREVNTKDLLFVGFDQNEISPHVQENVPITNIGVIESEFYELVSGNQDNPDDQASSFADAHYYHWTNNKWALSWNAAILGACWCNRHLHLLPIVVKFLSDAIQSIRPTNDVPRLILTLECAYTILSLHSGRKSTTYDSYDFIIGLASLAVRAAKALADLKAYGMRQKFIALAQSMLERIDQNFLSHNQQKDLASAKGDLLSSVGQVLVREGIENDWTCVMMQGIETLTWANHTLVVQNSGPFAHNINIICRALVHEAYTSKAPKRETLFETVDASLSEIHRFTKIDSNAPFNGESTVSLWTELCTYSVDAHINYLLGQYSESDAIDRLISIDNAFKNADIRIPSIVECTSTNTDGPTQLDVLKNSKLDWSNNFGTRSIYDSPKVREPFQRLFMEGSRISAEFIEFETGT